MFSEVRLSLCSDGEAEAQEAGVIPSSLAVGTDAARDHRSGPCSCASSDLRDF